VDTCGEKSDTFEQALDIWVGDLEPDHAQSGGDLWKLLGEFRAHLVQVLQFEVVVLQEPRVHLEGPRGRDIRHLDFAGFEVDLCADQESMATGCAHS